MGQISKIVKTFGRKFKAYSLLWLLLLTSYVPVHSQSLSEQVIGRYDINKKRLLAISTALNLYMILEGQIDLDSAMLMSCQAYNFSRLLPYSEGYDNGSVSVGRTMIDSGNINEAKRLLDKQKNDDKIRLALELGTYYLFKPGNNKTDLDQSLLYIRQAQKLAASSGKTFWKNESLTLLAKFYLQSGDILRSQKLFSEVVGSNKIENNNKGIALAMANQGINLPVGTPEKLSLLEKAQLFCKQQGLKDKEIEVLSHISIEYFISNFDVAKKKLLELVALQNASGYRHTHVSLNTISFIDDMRGDYIPALTSALQAVKTMEQTGDTKFAPLFYSRLALLYLHMDKKEGLDIYLKALENKSKQTRLVWYKSFVNAAQATITFYGGKRGLDLIMPIIKEYPPKSLWERMAVAYLQGDCYASLRQDKLAIHFFDLFLKLSDQMPAHFVYLELPSCYIGIAKFYANTGNKARTQYYLDKASPFMSSAGKLFISWQYSLVQFKLDSLNGNYVSAIKNYQRYKEKSDSNLSLASMRQMNFMQVQFETKNKEQSIKSLTQRGELQQAKLNESNFLRNVTMGGIVALLVIVGLLYKQFRLKQRNNEQLQIQRNEIVNKNQVLENLLEEKQWLLKEVHHRVKNNLHTVMSLLESQSAYLADDALSAIQNSQHRIHAMSLIHQKLYTSDDVTTIEMSTYIQELVSYLRESFTTGQRITFDLNVEPVELDVAQAIPLGLILNEAITNSLKYAFPDNRKGLISIIFAQLDDTKFKLSVEDDGVGLVAGFEQDKISSLGMKLMRGLSTELHADFRVESLSGTGIYLSFNTDILLKSSYQISAQN
ncbi:sensor histidine kinase [Dyadobacter psychrotolerans]|uniref:histidine kinase n=1 Tax=Dyadobacter psychrotolerans TaxID=2541721 RepID=A0A4R5DJJ7_9BACT|nr:sensor histidine kinase [Dyadobacter psychrotolerans]TDE10753.1 sensor histidine kinase [Dyadobacter psychrotolerans]